MTLINQMLQDLEKRRASNAERGALPDQVRVLPRAEKSGAPWWLLGSGVAVALIATLAWQLNNQPAPVSPAPAARVAPPAPAPAAVLPPAAAAPEMQPASRLALDLGSLPPRVAGSKPVAPGAELKAAAAKESAAPKSGTALRLAPGSGIWLMGLGISLQAINRNTEAQDAFRRAKATNALNPELQAFVDQRLKQLQ